MTSEQAPVAPTEPPEWQRFGVALLAIVFALWPFLYAPASRPDAALGADLVRDGGALVVEHPQLVSIAAGEGGFGALLASDWWGGTRADHVQYRPLSSALMGVAAWVAGPYDPARPGRVPLPYKLFVLALHAVAALLVVELGWRLFRKAPHAIAAGLLYVALPLHAHVIFDAGSLAVLLGTVLSLAALVAWCGARRGLAIGLAFLAALAHEVAFVLPAVALLLETRAARGGFGDGVRAAGGRVAGVLGLVAALGVAVAVRWSVAGSPLAASDLVDPVSNPLLDGTAAERVVNGLRMAAAGLGALVGLDPLASRVFGGSPDHSLAQVQVLPVLGVWNLVGVAVLFALAALAVALFRRCQTRGALALATLAALVLSSNAVLPLPAAFASVLLVLPGALLALFLAPFLGRRGKLGSLVALVFAVAGGLWQHAESRHWLRPIELWQHVADHTAKDSARAQLELGRRQLADLLHSMAQNRLQRAVELAPNSPIAHALLGDALASNFDPRGAAESLRRSVELVVERDGGHWEPRSERVDPQPAHLLYRVNQLEVHEGAGTAEAHLAWLDSLSARAYASPYVELYRARTLLELDRPEEAEAALRRSVELAPVVENVRSLGRLLLAQGRHGDALALYRDMAGRFEDQDAAEAEIALHRAGAELAEAPQRALELVQPLVEDAELSGEQRFQARLVAAQARLAVPTQDPVEQARQTRLASEDLIAGLAEYPEGTADTYFAAHMLARLLFDQGLGARARELLSGTLAYREGATQRMMLGFLLEQSGEHTEAVRQLDLARQGLVRDGRPIESAFYVSASVVRLRALANLAAAGEGAAYAEALAESEHPEQREAVARHLAVSGRADEALALARELGAGPRPQLAGLLPAFERAVELDRALAANTDDAGALQERSSLRVLLGDPQPAVADAKRAVELTGPSADRAVRLQFLAQAQRALGDSEAAHASLREALEQADVPGEVRAALERDAAVLAALLARE